MGELQAYLRNWSNTSRMATIRRVAQGYRPGWISGRNSSLSGHRPRRIPDKLYLDVETMGGECGGGEVAPSAPYQAAPCAPAPPTSQGGNVTMEGISDTQTTPCAPPKQWM